MQKEIILLKVLGKKGCLGYMWIFVCFFFTLEIFGVKCIENEVAYLSLLMTQIMFQAQKKIPCFISTLIIRNLYLLIQVYFKKTLYRRHCKFRLLAILRYLITCLKRI